MEKDSLAIKENIAKEKVMPEVPEACPAVGHKGHMPLIDHN